MSIVEKDSTGAVTDERLFIWAGLSILQERDGNNTITKNHFANGFENLSSGTQYYYTKDHLGSIREITDSSGTLVASYDYTPYGTRTLTSGSDISDFGYTGHFTHAKSGLLLASYRAYDPQLGRWLSRDPIAENGGINLYAYVLNDPINYFDPTGEVNVPTIVAIPVIIGSFFAARIIRSYVQTNYTSNPDTAVTPFPFIPLVIYSKEYCDATEPAKFVIDAHEKVHQETLANYFSEKEAYIETLVVSKKLLKEGWNGRPLSSHERIEVEMLKALALKQLEEMGYISNP